MAKKKKAKKKTTKKKATKIIFFQHQWVIIFLILATPFLLKMIILYFYNRRDYCFQIEFPAIANIIILHMKSGLSLRKSIELASSNSKTDSKIILEQLLELVVFSQQKVQENSRFNKLFTYHLLHKLVKIDHESNKSIEKLEALKNNIQIINEFRRRSGKIRAQVLSQLIVVVGMHFAMTAIMVYFFGFKKNLLIILTSYLFLAISSIFMLVMGKKIKWSI